MDALIVGAGLTGSIIARCLAETGLMVTIMERREHVGGNMRDHVDEHGILVQDYGPHAFHTNSTELVRFISRFESWKPFRLRCGAVIDGVYSPTPFNYTTLDTFFGKEEARRIKGKFEEHFNGRETVTVVEALSHEDEDIRRYAEFLFEKDYAPYTAKQWGMDPSEVDPSILKRVPLRLSYKDGYFDDEYQLMPEHSYAEFFTNLLDHENIEVILGCDALEHLRIENNTVYMDGEKLSVPLVYTGAVDELFDCRYGKLPYRSLRFEWEHSDDEIIQDAPIVAYPQEDGFTRITEYKQLPVQDAAGSTYAREYPLEYGKVKGAEPYYPVLTDESMELYEKYRRLASMTDGLVLCGRLADYKYYNMDQAMERALEAAGRLQDECAERLHDEHAVRQPVM